MILGTLYIHALHDFLYFNFNKILESLNKQNNQESLDKRKTATWIIIETSQITV